MVYLNKPINDFNEQIRRFSTDKEVESINEGTVVKEFKPMVSTFVTMKSLIVDQFEELKQLNTDLEQRVSERTAKLEKAKEEG